MKRLAILYAAALILFVILVDLGVGRRVLEAATRVPGVDELGHFSLMGLLSLLVNLALSAATFRVGPLRVLWGSATVLAVVLLEEFSQLFLVERTFAWSDLACDVAGIFLFGRFAAWWVARQSCREGAAVTSAAVAE